MDNRAVVIASVWLSVAIISSVYMFVFADRLSDVFFGVFLPVGVLVLIAFIVTFGVMYAPEKKQ